MTAATATATRCHRATPGHRHDKKPPASTNPMNVRWLMTTKSARRTSIVVPVNLSAADRGRSVGEDFATELDEERVVVALVGIVGVVLGGSGSVGDVFLGVDRTD